MKILFITDLIPINDENITKALSNFVTEWQKQGHSVDVIRPNIIINSLIRGRKVIKEKCYEENNIHINNLNFITPFWFNIYKKLPKDFSLKNYDVMISHMPSGALFANKLLKKDKIKYICSVHASDIIVLKRLKYSIYFRKELQKAYKKADKISARSPILKKKIETIIPNIENKTFIAYSGIDDEIFENKDNKKIEITTTASLIKRKNIDVIIKALHGISNDFHLTIMGDGKERKKLENLTKKLNLQNKITFTGKISREEVVENLRKSDIFILLSENETFGLCYLEAMATGNIVIAKKDDGIDGILKHKKNAFLAKANHTDLRNTIIEILHLSKNEIAEIKNQSIKTVKELTAEKAAKNYIENIL